MTMPPDPCGSSSSAVQAALIVLVLSDSLPAEATPTDQRTSATAMAVARRNACMVIPQDRVLRAACTPTHYVLRIITPKRVNMDLRHGRAWSVSRGPSCPLLREHEADPGPLDLRVEQLVVEQRDGVRLDEHARSGLGDDLIGLGGALGDGHLEGRLAGVRLCRNPQAGAVGQL